MYGIGEEKRGKVLVTVEGDLWVLWWWQVDKTFYGVSYSKVCYSLSTTFRFIFSTLTTHLLYSYISRFFIQTKQDPFNPFKSFQKLVQTWEWRKPEYSRQGQCCAQDPKTQAHTTNCDSPEWECNEEEGELPLGSLIHSCHLPSSLRDPSKTVFIHPVRCRAMCCLWRLLLPAAFKMPRA
jgi:hypothetical protein